MVIAIPKIFKNQVTLLTDGAQLTEGGIEVARATAAALRDSPDAAYLDLGVRSSRSC
jgi:hypothetical protein